MLHKTISIALCLAALLFSIHAAAHPSRTAFEAVATEPLIVERNDGIRVYGTLAHVDDTRVVLVDSEGEVHEISLDDVARLRVDRTTDAHKTNASTPANNDAKTSEPPGYFDTDSARQGYVDPAEPQTSDFEGGSDAQGENPFAGHPYEPTGVRYRLNLLSYQDYAAYQSMLDASQYKRMVGWSLFASGLGFFALMTLQVRDARRAHQQPQVRAFATLGALTTLVGLPVAIAGRQQYKRAQRFAENAATYRRKALEDAHKKEAAKHVEAPTPTRSEIGYTRDHIQTLKPSAPNADESPADPQKVSDSHDAAPSSDAPAHNATDSSNDEETNAQPDAASSASDAP